MPSLKFDRMEAEGEGILLSILNEYINNDAINNIK